MATADGVYLVGGLHHAGAAKGIVLLVQPGSSREWKEPCPGTAAERFTDDTAMEKSSKIPEFIVDFFEFEVTQDYGWGFRA